MKNKGNSGKGMPKQGAVPMGSVGSMTGGSNNGTMMGENPTPVPGSPPPKTSIQSYK